MTTALIRTVRRTAVAVLLGLALGGCGRRSEPQPPSRPDGPRLRLAVSRQTPSALALLAWKAGAAGGGGPSLDVTEHVSGSRALAALQSGEADLATVADVPVALAAFGGGDFRILACIGTTGNECSIVARRDRGIRNAADLRGKVIGTQKASAVHFFLHCFLVHHGLADSDVTLRFRKAEELPADLAAGNLDAFSMREPYVSRALALLGTNAVVFQVPGLYFRHELLVARADAVAATPEALRAVIEAILIAEQRVRANPGEALRAVSAALGVEQKEMEALWPELDLRVSLDQALLLTLEDEARWAIRAGLVDGTAAPNYLPLTEWRMLHDLDPERVGLIH